jgi:hypothetical protein
MQALALLPILAIVLRLSASAQQTTGNGYQNLRLASPFFAME